MGVQIVGSCGAGDVEVPPLSFEGACDTRGVVPPGFAEGDERLAVARVCCHKRGAGRSGRDCLACDAFRGWADAGLAEIRVRCVWSSRDAAAACMTPAAELVTVAPEVPCAAADALARDADVRHIVVLRDGVLVGVVCRCRLYDARDDAPIGHLIDGTVFALDVDATLGEAAGAMAALGIGCLPLVDGDRVVGVITRGDLRRLGAPEAQLGAHCCAGCGSVHGVRADDHGVDTCLDCLELHDAFLSAAQFGEGD
jgi:CBS domain-containing protein